MKDYNEYLDGVLKEEEDWEKYYQLTTPTMRTALNAPETKGFSIRPFGGGDMTYPMSKERAIEYAQKEYKENLKWADKFYEILKKYGELPSNYQDPKWKEARKDLENAGFELFHNPPYVMTLLRMLADQGKIQVADRSFNGKKQPDGKWFTDYSIIVK